LEQSTRYWRERERSEMKERKEGKREGVKMFELREQDLTLLLTE